MVKETILEGRVLEVCVLLLSDVLCCEEFLKVELDILESAGGSGHSPKCAGLLYSSAELVGSSL